jgi:uncharacterized protein (TIGR01244 family)
MHRSCSAFLILFATTALAAGCRSAGPAPEPEPVLEAVEWPETARVHRFGDIYLASQPSEAALEAAAAQGFRVVASQRTAGEPVPFDERARAEELGMTWVNPGFRSPAELDAELLERTIELFRTAERPLLVHCGSANRTGATWFAYRVVEGGLDPEEALAEAREVGLRSPELEAAVRAYLEARD